jgi:CRP-like cAMP-binding protein
VTGFYKPRQVIFHEGNPASGLYIVCHGSVKVYSRRELAEMIGVSTETAIRLLGKLKRSRVIATGDGDIVITDVERLKRLARHADLQA